VWLSDNGIFPRSELVCGFRTTGFSPAGSSRPALTGHQPDSGYSYVTDFMWKWCQKVREVFEKRLISKKVGKRIKQLLKRFRLTFAICFRVFFKAKFA